MEGAFPNGQGTLEEEGDEFDDTLEQLMTLDNSAAAGASMITDNAEPGKEGEAKAKEEEDKSANESAASVKKVIRILRFLQLLVEGHFTPL